MLATMPPKASSASSPCSTARHFRRTSVDLAARARHQSRPSPSQRIHLDSGSCAGLRTLAQVEATRVCVAPQEPGYQRTHWRFDSPGLQNAVRWIAQPRETSARASVDVEEPVTNQS